MSLLTIFDQAPAFEVWHSHPDNNSQVLITAGVDGDEYAGIAAAHKLIEQFTETPPPIPVTIIPIVNLAGYRAGTSFNPLDSRYPKSIYPGSPLGTSSSRLMWEVSRHVQGVGLWLDLHGGAKDEHLLPFVWADQTGNPQIDQKTLMLLSSLNTTTLYSRNTLPPAKSLAKQGCSYLMFESGELGLATNVMVDQHLSWVDACLNNYLAPAHNQNFSPTYTKLCYNKGPAQDTHNLLWSSPTYYATAS